MAAKPRVFSIPESGPRVFCCRRGRFADTSARPARLVGPDRAVGGWPGRAGGLQAGGRLWRCGTGAGKSTGLREPEGHAGGRLGLCRERPDG